MKRIFWGFCRNWFLIDPSHYLSSRSDFDFEFTEIFVIEKRLPDSANRRVGFWMFKRKLTESESRGVDDSPTRRVGESLWWDGELVFKFFTIFHHFKALNQPFKRSIWQKRSQGCHVLSPLIYLKVWKNCIYRESFFDYEYLREFEVKIGMARNLV